MIKRAWTMTGAIASALLVAGLAASPSHAQTGQSVAAKLKCGPHSANPKKLRDFQVNFVFTLSGGELKATRKLRSGGEETFTGIVSPNGSIVVTGKGNNTSDGAWLYDFRGKRELVANTVLTGRLENTGGVVGTRKCTLTFFKERSL